jgi:hypothetical protein
MPSSKGTDGQLGLVVVAAFDATRRVGDAEHLQRTDMLDPRAPVEATRGPALPYLDDADDQATHSDHESQPAEWLAEHMC